MISALNFFIFLTSAVICIILVPIMAKLSIRVGGVDIPDDRKIHSKATSRLGGVAIFSSLLFAIIFFCEIDQQLKGILSGAIIIFLTGLADDLTNLTPRQKFAGEFAAAGLAVFMGGLCVTNLGNPFGLGILELGPFGIPFTIIGIVGVINAINLLDGLDGLASGVCTIATIAFMIVAYQSDNTTLFPLLIAILGSLIGFFLYNNYPAQIFMGDSGSLLLGYFMGSFSVMLAGGGEVPVSPYIPLIILGVPILDTVTVIVNRKRSGKHLFMPDNTHLQHRLLGLGIGHKYAVLIVLGLSYVFSFAGIIFQHASDTVLLLLLALIYSVVYGLLHTLKTKGWTARYDLSSNQSLQSSTMHRTIIQYSEILIIIVKLLVIAIMTLPLLLSRSDISLLSVIPLVLLTVSAGFYLTAPAWRNNILQAYIYSAGSFLIFVVDNFGRNDFLLGVPLLNYSYGMFLLLLLFSGIKIVLRKRALQLITSPFEYLIILIVLSIPLMPETITANYHLMTVAAKSVILFVGFKIILAKEYKQNSYFLMAIMIISLGLSVRSLLGV